MMDNEWKKENLYVVLGIDANDAFPFESGAYIKEYYSKGSAKISPGDPTEGNEVVVGGFTLLPLYRNGTPNYDLETNKKLKEDEMSLYSCTDASACTRSCNLCSSAFTKKRGHLYFQRPYQNASSSVDTAPLKYNEYVNLRMVVEEPTTNAMLFVRGDVGFDVKIGAWFEGTTVTFTGGLGKPKSEDFIIGYPRKGEAGARVLWKKSRNATSAMFKHRFTHIGMFTSFGQSDAFRHMRSILACLSNPTCTLPQCVEMVSRECGSDANSGVCRVTLPVTKWTGGKVNVASRVVEFCSIAGNMKTGFCKAAAVNFIDNTWSSGFPSLSTVVENYCKDDVKNNSKEKMDPFCGCFKDYIVKFGTLDGIPANVQQMMGPFKCYAPSCNITDSSKTVYLPAIQKDPQAKCRDNVICLNNLDIDQNGRSSLSKITNLKFENNCTGGDQSESDKYHKQMQELEKKHNDQRKQSAKEIPTSFLHWVSSKYAIASLVVVFILVVLLRLYHTRNTPPKKSITST